LPHSRQQVRDGSTQTFRNVSFYVGCSG